MKLYEQQINLNWRFDDQNYPQEPLSVTPPASGTTWPGWMSRAGWFCFWFVIMFLTAP